MGLRSWLTRVDDVDQWNDLETQIENAELAYGLVYVINITKECLLEKGMWVAWSGDTTGSLWEVSKHFQDQTWLLDNMIDEFPAYNDDPSQYGDFMDDDKYVISVLNETKRKEAAQ
ncbi:hypothetical protein LCGC14_2028880 [marine sediment metagenome]|uniref:Uncharacterized protein n=1 Tax=marine sediment metagenome TaxID=412755 RepID=A0A0F9HSD9_9ZZZZ